MDASHFGFSFNIFITYLVTGIITNFYLQKIAFR